MYIRIIILAQLTVVKLDTSATRVAGTTACPVLAATLLPDWDSSDSSSEDGCGGDELLHDCEPAIVVEMLELVALLALKRGSLRRSIIYHPRARILSPVYVLTTPGPTVLDLQFR